MKRIAWFTKLLRICTTMAWRNHISYMGWLALVHFFGLMIGYLGEYAVLFTMIQNFPALGDFTALEVCFLYAMGLMGYALGNYFTRMFWEIDQLVQQGGLDTFLIRPVAPLTQLFVWNLQVGYISHILLGLASMFLVKGLMGLSWTAEYWAVFIVSILAGGVIMNGISIIATPLAFWWGRAESVAGFVRWDLKQAASYPHTIYPKPIRHLLLVIPYAFVNYLPCLYLFNKPTPIPPWLIPVCALAAGALIHLAFWVFWRLGLRRYNSAGG